MMPTSAESCTHRASLIDGFLHSANTAPDAPALVLGGRAHSYGQLLRACRKIAAAVRTFSTRPFCGVLGSGTISAYENVLGVLLAGRAYVPLNPSFPASRTAYMLAESEADLVLVDAAGEAVLPRVLGLLDRPFTIVLRDAADASGYKGSYPAMNFVTAQELDILAHAVAGPGMAPTTSPYPAAYLMFTSGSTGRPKGVVVDHANVRRFIDSVRALYDFGPDDRFSQMFDLTFDLSVFDMFLSWEVGASLWVVPHRARLAPVAFLRNSRLTVWFSVPAVGAYMKRLGALRPGNFPTLRYSLFCGEPLPVSIARAWQEAAPRSRLLNLYGPTELTIACAHYGWKGEDSLPECAHGLVPIGHVFPGLESAIVDSDLSPVPDGENGELCIRGPQASPGYWRRPDLTARRFVSMPWAAGDGNRWYRTGDVVRRTASGEMVFIGRLDHQVKIRGYRVELGEVEARLREFARTEFAVAVPWPLAEGGAASGLVACISGSSVAEQAVLDGCARTLPDYMVPQRLLRMEAMPLNVNGKVDRNALSAIVGESYGRG